MSSSSRKKGEKVFEADKYNIFGFSAFQTISCFQTVIYSFSVGGDLPMLKCWMRGFFEY